MQMTEKQALALIDKEVVAAGSQKAMALKHGLSPQFVNDVVLGRKVPSKAILDAVGLERVVSYRRKPNPKEKPDAR